MFAFLFMFIVYYYYYYYCLPVHLEIFENVVLVAPLGVLGGRGDVEHVG